MQTKVSKCSVVASSYTRKSLASDGRTSVPSKIIEPSTTEIKPVGKETSDSGSNTSGSPTLYPAPTSSTITPAIEPVLTLIISAVEDAFP